MQKALLVKFVAKSSKVLPHFKTDVHLRLPSPVTNIAGQVIAVGNPYHLKLMEKL